MSGLTLSITIPNSPGHFQAGENNGISTGNSANYVLDQQPVDQQTIEQLAQLLAELLKPLISSRSGDSSGDVYGTSLLSGSGNPGGPNSASGNSLLSSLGGTGGLSGQTGSVSGSSQADSLSMLNDMSSNGLDQSLTADGQGGGNISDNPLLKALLKLIAQMMDGLNGPFGQPGGSDEASSGGSSLTGCSGDGFSPTTSPVFSGQGGTSVLFGNPAIDSTMSPRLAIRPIRWAAQAPVRRRMWISLPPALILKWCTTPLSFQRDRFLMVKGGPSRPGKNWVMAASPKARNRCSDWKTVPA